VNNLYHKVAVASICTALGIILGASEEVKAATITLTAPRFVVQGDSKMGGLAVLNSSYSGPSIVKSDPSTLETRTFYEFYISSLSLAPNTVIKSAFFNFQLNNITNGYKSHFIDIVGYVGNGIPEL
jgi:hypothetical protein